MLALHMPLSKWGWVAFLVANLALIAFSYRARTWGLLTQQLGFTVTSVLGILRSGIFN
jgi:hypothetical protein